ncbi:hypothetical protein CCM_09235 [Cordyceps militaris CM01]|uniref:Uncharacterized protein n=1 Tax=Cordyceps militaris (strain CM01) TaxID=983644 RepID=G3JTU5_CORMM|nr:uncharacterized protein CCM_09235 [Cordyceps militaris CM01]EGX88099.1 hypothetical protein CCM_09235 [Cordyceps militaris CM01]
MSSGNTGPPPSYGEATAHVHSASSPEETRPEGWVEGYVEAPRAGPQAAEYRPPAPAPDKAATGEEQPRSRLSFGGLDLGGRVLGFGSGDGVGGWGVKIGPVMVGLVDVEAEKRARAAEDAKGS